MVSLGSCRHLSKVFRVIDVAQGMLDKGMENVQAVNFIPSRDGKIKGNNGNNIWPRNVQGRVKAGQKFRELIKVDELGCTWIISMAFIFENAYYIT
jgi:predicted Rdx family selenoprotein